MTATEKNKQFFFVKNKQLMKRVDVPEIRYITAEGNFCYFTTGDKEDISIKISLRQLIQYFDEDQFIRVHKSYVVNVDFITQVNIKDRTLLLGDRNIPIGRTYYKDLSDHLSLF